jgi:hypothetical protein
MAATVAGLVPHQPCDLVKRVDGTLVLSAFVAFSVSWPRKNVSQRHIVEQRTHNNASHDNKSQRNASHRSASQNSASHNSVAQERFDEE